MLKLCILMGIATVESLLTAASLLLHVRLPFLVGSLYIQSCLNLFRMATSLQQPLSSDLKLAIVERFNPLSPNIHIQILQTDLFTFS